MSVSISGRDTKVELLHVVSSSILLLALIVTACGLFINNAGEPFRFINQHGDIVRIWGSGTYRNDSFFRAPIFIGTDSTMLFLACPLLLVTLIVDIRESTLRSRLSLTSLIACFLYYAASICFGVYYNQLHLLYIVLFGSCLFGFIMSMRSIDMISIDKCIRSPLPRKGVYTFLIFTGLALLLAWLPDIFSAMRAERPPLLIENYTTEITYVLDMGVIAPACFVCIYLLGKNSGVGYVLLDILLTLCIIIGIMLPVQTAFQWRAGIELPLPVLVTKVGIFCLLATFAIYFKWRLVTAIKNV